MNKKLTIKNILFGVFVISLIGLLVYEFRTTSLTVHEYYRVYLSGRNLGLISSDEELYALIDKEQVEIKEKYGVDKVYPPQGLEIQKVHTYKNNIKTSQEIYDEIKDLDPFTIEGYIVKVSESDVDSEQKIFYVLHKEDLDKALRNTVTAFIPEEDYENYLNGTQENIDEGGTKISNIYFNEDVSIKKTYISTEEDIITNEDDMSQFFLFSTTHLDKKYVVKESDTIETIADKNELGVSDFLIANPDIVSENALLAIGQEVSVASIDPVANIVVETFETSYQDIDYDTIVEYDKNLDASENYVKQQGSKGTSKVTYATKYLNGMILQTGLVSEEIISEPVDKIVVYGAKNITYIGNSTYWAWPTTKPYRISSYFGWRVCPFHGNEYHGGLDITGTSSRNIYAIQSGTVTASVSGGYNGGKGSYVNIKHNDTYTSTYWHLSKTLVSEGEHVDKGQLIGIMGCTGSCTGTHLDFRVLKNGSEINPFNIYQ